MFSILFRKQFGAIALTDTYSGMNSRLQSLFEIIGCGERYLKDGDFSVLDGSVNCTMGEHPQFDMSELVNE